MRLPIYSYHWPTAMQVARERARARGVRQVVRAFQPQLIWAPMSHAGHSPRPAWSISDAVPVTPVGFTGEPCS